MDYEEVSIMENEKKKKTWIVFVIVGALLILIFLCCGFGAISGITATIFGFNKSKEESKNIEDDNYVLDEKNDIEDDKETADIEEDDYSATLDSNQLINIFDTSVSEEYAKTHEGYYLKIADGTLYPLDRRIKDITINSDTYGVPYKSGEGFGTESGTDLYWRIDDLFQYGYGIMSCGEVPIPTVVEGEVYSVIQYTSWNYGSSLPELEVIATDNIGSPCTPLSFFLNQERDSYVPAYGIYGEGRHYIGREDNYPYVDSPITLETLDGDYVGQFKFTGTGSIKNNLEKDGNVFDDLRPRQKYRWSWYEGSQYREVELSANSSLYCWNDSDILKYEAELTKEGYYEYKISDYLADGVYIIRDRVIWVLDPGWDPFEYLEDVENPTFYDLLWR